MTIPKSRWRWAWVAWIVTFLCIEIPAALDKGAGKTLSETLRRWFPTVLSRVLLSFFFAILAGHLWWGWSAWHLGILGVLIVWQAADVEWQARKEAKRIAYVEIRSRVGG